MVTKLRNLTEQEVEGLRQEALDHYWMHARQVNDLKEPGAMRVMTEGKGCWVTQADGTRYFDALSGLWVKAAGYGRKEIADAVYETMLTGMTYHPTATASPNSIRLASRVAGISPDKESRVFLVSGGSEAVETAVKMAKKYHRNRGEAMRFKIISRTGSYHGATHLCMTLGGGSVANSQDYGPVLLGTPKTTQPQQYRCHHCRDEGQCNLKCAYDVERTIEAEGPEQVAAVIGEPVSAAASVAVPHPDYWPTLRAICDKYGVLLIVDEVITGFGRTGKMFASEHWGLKPDIMTVAKALTSGYLPIGAAIASKKVADTFVGGESETFRHLITFGGNPVSAAAALANLDIFEEEDLVGNSDRMGEYMSQQLQTLYEHPIVGDIRHAGGLLFGIELVKDKETREKFPKEADLRKRLTKLMHKHHVFMIANEVIALAPPLCITREEVDHVVKTVDTIIGELEKELDIA